MKERLPSREYGQYGNRDLILHSPCGHQGGCGCKHFEGCCLNCPFPGCKMERAQFIQTGQRGTPGVQVLRT